MPALRPTLALCALGGLTAGLYLLASAPVEAPERAARSTPLATGRGPAAASASFAESVTWAPGHTYRFQLSHHTRTRLMATARQPEGLEGALSWSAILALTPAEDAEGPHLVVAVEEAEVARFVIFGQPSASALDGLERVTARVSLEPGGGLGEVRFGQGAPEAPRRVLHEAIRQLRYEVSTGSDRWISEHGDAFGEGPVEYTVISSDAEGWAARRTRETYDALRVLAGADANSVVSGAGQIQAGPGGGLLAVSESLKLKVVDASERLLLEGEIEIALRRLSVDSASPLVTTRWRDPAQGSEDRGRAQALEDRVGEMSLAQALAELAGHADASVGPGHAEWLWRVTGLLKQRPELCGPFVEAILDAGEGFKAQRLALDLLASTGHAQAQSAMRRLLDETALTDEADRHRMVQSFLMVESPTADTAAFLGAIYEEGGPSAQGAANALGVVAAQLAHQGDEAEAAAVVRRLRAGLADASDHDHRRAHVMALGNSGHPDALAPLLEIGRGEAADLRRLAARGLGRQAPGAAHDALVALLEDEAPEVGAEALRSLARHGLQRGDLDGLSEVLGEAGVPLAMARVLVSAAERGALPAEEV